MNVAEILREQFGDGKAPDITRKITACVACRKQKIKCHIKDGKPPCSRCVKRGLPCTVNKSLQTILQSDVVWKHDIEKRLERLEERAGAGIVAGDTTTPPDAAADDGDDDDDHPHAWEMVMGAPGAIPGSVVTALPTSNQDHKPDMLTQGLVTLAEAEELLAVYHDRLDHFVYRVLGDSKTLAEIRESSSLLLAAICAVGALHLATPNFDKLHQHFVAVASAQSFSRRLNTDDVRGLCIGAFWLSGISWACVANAVRLSTELQLHRSIYGAIEGDRAHYLRTRLYYLVFVCDHHFSIPYGRPPMTTYCEAIRANQHFLDSKHAVEDDYRLVSQVRLWQVSANVYLTLGTDVDRPLNSAMLDSIRRFGIEVDGIRADWTERFARNQYVGNYPKKGVGLHYHFARLYLCSHAFRGVSQPNFRSSDVALDIDELINAALLSATSILQTIVSDAEIPGYFNGLPTYFDLMIAFAVVFVLKVSTSYASYVRVDISKIMALVAELVVVLNNVIATMHPRHILASVARGSETLLQKCEATQRGLEADQQFVGQDFYDVPVNWSDLTLDNFYMGDF